MNLVGLSCVLDKNEIDCIIIETPLKDIIAEIKERVSGVMVVDSIFAPFVISIMPDITPWKIKEFSLFKLKIDAIKENSLRFVKRSIIRVNSAI